MVISSDKSNKGTLFPKGIYTAPNSIKTYRIKNDKKGSTDKLTLSFWLKHWSYYKSLTYFVVT